MPQQLGMLLRLIPRHAAAQVYGGYYRKLSKKVQAALAEANAVAEEVLSAMPTVRARGVALPCKSLHAGASVSALARI